MAVFLAGRQQTDRTDEKARFEEVLIDGVAPDGFYCTTNLLTYVNVEGKTILGKDHRMDCALVRRKEECIDDIIATEIRNLRKGDQVVIARREDGSQGVRVSDGREVTESEEKKGWGFMQTKVSWEKPIDYKGMADVIASKHHYNIWVLGPAVIHTKAIGQMEWLIENHYVQALFGGNAIAVHDIENQLYGTTLGMDKDGNSVEYGHRNHLDAINTVNRYGGIRKMVEAGALNAGIMYACIKNDVPYILAGSIRDDGPLLDTITDTLESQERMREHTKKATCAVILATALHGIATGNMLPAYNHVQGKLRPVEVICVDQSEFVVNKLADRGTSQAYGVVANAQDFLYRIVAEFGRQEYQ